MRCTNGEKQHMLDLIAEMKGYADNILAIRNRPKKERREIADRMTAIVKEMKEFRRMYPDD